MGIRGESGQKASDSDGAAPTSASAIQLSPGRQQRGSKVERTTLRSDDQAIGSWQEMS